MRIKIDTKRLVNIGYNVVVTGIISELVNGAIKAAKTKLKSLKERNRETQ